MAYQEFCKERDGDSVREVVILLMCDMPAAMLYVKYKDGRPAAKEMTCLTEV